MGSSRSLQVLAFLAVTACAPIAYAQCPNKPRYVTKADTNWLRSDKTTESQTQPAAAEQICNLDSNCLAFNNFGYYILKKAEVAPTIAAAGIKFQPYDTLCTYVKATALPACPEKAGYVTKADTNWLRSDKTSESQTQPAAAEQICNLDGNCLAFNNFGYYILKKAEVAPTIAAAGIKFQPYEKMCTYVKASADRQLSDSAGGGTPWQAVPPPSSGLFVLRNSAAKVCFAEDENERVPLGLPRLLLSRCSGSDKSQSFKVVPAGSAYRIIDNQGRCVTTFTGLLVRTAVLMPCGSNRADQLWSLSSVSSSGKGPYTIKSKDTGTCIKKDGNYVSLQSCNPSDPSSLFEPARI